MKVGNRYRLSIKIKLHTSPLRMLEYMREGVFVKETAKCFVFKDFMVRKANVIGILEC